jgi:alanine racemase
MLARLAGNAAHLKVKGAITEEKTATKSNMADRQGLRRGFAEVFTRLIACSGLFAGEPAPTWDWRRPGLALYLWERL